VSARWTVSRYLAYLARKGGKDGPRRVRASKAWSGPERRYFATVLGGRGVYEGEVIRITPGECERHEYTPDFVTEAETLDSVYGPRGRSLMSPSAPIAHKVYHEVKGSYRLGSQDAARLRWCFAALARPDAVFVWAKEQGKSGLWTVEVWRHGGRTRDRARNVLRFEFGKDGGVIWHTATRASKR